MPYIGKQPLTGAYQLCDTITTSATATYNLTVGGSAVIPGSAQNCIVSLNGVIQAPVTAFTVSGSQITFASALTATDVIDFILILGNVFDIGTPTNGSVTNSSLNSNVITGQTAVTVPATDDVLLCYDTSATALRKITFADFGNTPAFEAYLSANQSGLTDATYVKVTSDTEVFDTDNCYDNSVNYRFTPTVAGKYFVYSSINIYGSVNDAIISCQNAIYKNGSSYKEITTNPGSGTTPNFHAISTFNYAIIDMNGTTDYLELFGRSDASSGTVSFLNANTLKSTYFGAYRLIGV